MGETLNYLEFPAVLWEYNFSKPDPTAGAAERILLSSI